MRLKLISDVPGAAGAAGGLYAEPAPVGASNEAHAVPVYLEPTPVGAAVQHAAYEIPVPTYLVPVPGSSATAAVYAEPAQGNANGSSAYDAADEEAFEGFGNAACAGTF